jgi:colanic acid/amylovoran biosynthesis glycosyltransferase
MTSGHLTYCYLHRSENWLYRRLSGLKRYAPIILAPILANEAEYALPGLRYYHRLPRWRRALCRIPLGPFPNDRPDLRYWWNELKRARCRVLHSHFAGAALQNVALRTLARQQLHCPTVTSFYGHDLLDIRDSRDGEGERLLAEEAGFIVEGPCLGERLVDAGCAREKVHLNALGVDLTLFPERIAREPEADLRVLMVGRFVEKKGMPDGIRAVALARQKGARIRLTIIGDGERRIEIEETLRREHAGDFVSLAGSLDYAQLVTNYYAHDVLLQPSRVASDGDTEGGAPVSITEGMAAGLPIVATRHADIPNVVSEGVNALLSPERDTERLAEALTCLASDEALRARLGRASRIRAVEHFDSVKQAARLEAIYDQLLA